MKIRRRIVNIKNKKETQISVTGITQSGTIKELDVQLIKNEEKLMKKKTFEEEYFLINKLPEAGVEIKTKLKDSGPSDIEKMMFMLGEATYALALMTKKESNKEADIEHFTKFMKNFTEIVVKYHK